MAQAQYLWLAVEPWQLALSAVCGLLLLCFIFRKRLNRWVDGAVEYRCQPHEFRVVALWLIAGLYVPWFFLVVFAIGDKKYDLTGLEVFFQMFLHPTGWIFAAGHVLLWLGALRLAKMRWRAAMILGVTAALVSLIWTSVFAINFRFLLGPWFKIASMCALAVAGLVGHLCYGRKFPPGHCVKCGYNLTGNVSGRCPECGKPA